MLLNHIGRLGDVLLEQVSAQSRVVKVEDGLAMDQPPCTWISPNAHGSAPMHTFLRRGAGGLMVTT